MMDELVRMYEKGAITVDHLVVESLHKIDPAEPGLVLSILPREVLERMLAYSEQYRPGAMRTNYGLQPASDQVAAAKRWIESSLGDSNGAAVSKPDCVQRS
jgi:hypothetical protein